MTVYASLFKKINITLYNSSQSLDFFYEGCIILIVKPDRHTRENKAINQSHWRTERKIKSIKYLQTGAGEKARQSRAPPTYQHHLKLQFQGSWGPLLAFTSTAHMWCIYTHRHTGKTEENKINLTLKKRLCGSSNVIGPHKLTGSGTIRWSCWGKCVTVGMDFGVSSMFKTCPCLSLPPVACKIKM